jgi:hypothetical protein
VDTLEGMAAGIAVLAPIEALTVGVGAVVLFLGHACVGVPRP